MSTKTYGLDPSLQAYLIASSLREDAALQALRGETDGMAHSVMRSSPEQMQFLQLLMRSINAKQVLEVGCFVGYGALAMALALPEDGRLVTLDVNDDWAAIGRKYWQQAGVADKIDFRSGHATDSLTALIDEGRSGHFDFAYIDADKKGYPGYFEQCLTLLRGGGIIALDNMFQHGRVADPDDESHQAATIRTLTLALRDRDDIDFSLVPIGDGVALARKRG